MDTMESIPFGDDDVFDGGIQQDVSDNTGGVVGQQTQDQNSEGDYDLSYEDLHSHSGHGMPTADLETNDADNQDKSAIDSFLESHGVDPKGVLIGDERVPFDSLGHDHQLDIITQLNTVVKSSDPEVDLNDSEIELINRIREKGSDVDTFLNQYAQESAAELINQAKQEQESISNFSDDELFLADLFSTVGEISEQEALEQLEIAKSNPNIFSKKMAVLREEYVAREEELERQEKEKLEQQQMEQLKQTEKLVVEHLNNRRSLDLGSTVLDLSPEDLDQVASFILDSDSDGVNHLEKALSNPESLVDMALFAIKGREIITNLDSYYKDQIKQVAKFNYEKGLAEAKGGKPKTKSITKNVKSNPSSNNKRGPLSIHEIPL